MPPHPPVPGDGEFAILARLRAALPPAPPGEVHSGDDAAVVAAPAGALLLATDLLAEGVHFDLALGSLADAGWKAVAVNVSDVAAMGGIPLHLLAAVAAPAGSPAAQLDELAAGLGEAASHFGARLVGGDLSEGAAYFVAVSVTGTCDGPPVLRSGARPGDRIFVTGPLGAAAAGLRSLRAGGGPPGGGPDAGPAGALARAYLRPEARVAEGLAARRAGATAMIDVSDGLLGDMGHVAEESAVGFELGEVPVAPGATEDDALGGGEDYELVFTWGGRGEPAGFVAEGLREPLEIGVVTSRRGEALVRGRPVAVRSFEHSFGGRARPRPA